MQLKVRVTLPNVKPEQFGRYMIIIMKQNVELCYIQPFLFAINMNKGVITDKMSEKFFVQTKNFPIEVIFLL